MGFRPHREVPAERGSAIPMDLWQTDKEGNRAKTIDGDQGRLLCA